MKNIIIPIIALVIFSVSTASTQVYSTSLDRQYVTISIDMNTYEDALIVTRDLVEKGSGEILQSSDIQLIGNFQVDKEKIILDYVNNIYYFVPFNNEPIRKLNKIKSKDHKRGLIFIGNTNRTIEPGDNVGTYNCQCGSWIPDITVGPGGCASNLSNNRITCVRETATSCAKGCQGSLTPGPSGIIFEGGGTLIGVSNNRKELFYRI